jgi:hypothetical protein
MESQKGKLIDCLRKAKLRPFCREKMRGQTASVTTLTANGRSTFTCLCPLHVDHSEAWDVINLDSLHKGAGNRPENRVESRFCHCADLEKMGAVPFCELIHLAVRNGSVGVEADSVSDDIDRCARRDNIAPIAEGRE